MSTEKSVAPPSRFPVAMFLAPRPAKPQDIAAALGMTEAEVLGVLGWHRLRRHVVAGRTEWRLTQDGHDWLALYADSKPSRGGGAGREVVRVTKARPLSATTVRERLTLAGLWPFVEAFAREHGVPLMALVGPERTKYLAQVRHELYAALLAYPGRSYSGPEVAWYMGRHCHSTVYHGAAQSRARKQQAENAA